MDLASLTVKPPGPVVLLRNGRGYATPRQLQLLLALRRCGLTAATAAPVEGFRFQGRGGVELISVNPFRQPCFVGMVELNDPRKPPPPPWLVGQGVLDPDESLTHNQQCRRLLNALAARGVTVNHDQSLCAIGVKWVLEKRCRAYERATGERIPRPLTFLRRRPDDPAPTSDWRIVKPINGARAEGIVVLPRETPTDPSAFPTVEQELVAYPVLLEGRKIDCRAYVFVWNRPRFGFALSPYIRVRHAPGLFRLGSADAEICSTTRSRRSGKHPLLSDLATLAHAQPELGQLFGAVRDAVEPLMRMVETFVPATNFFSIWGLDLAPRRGPHGMEAQVLEVNPYPQLYNGDPTADGWTERELAPEFARRLSDHVEACVTGAAAAS